MSFGDPNNPYAQGQQGGQQGQPGYGYPQQAPQGVPPQGQQPGYGYPQAPPVQQQYGGYPGVPQEMPGGVKAARVMLYVIAGFQVIGAILFGLTAVTISAAKNEPSLRNDVQFQDLADMSSGALWGGTVLVLLWGVLAIFLAVKFGSGGNGIRITTIVFGAITALLGIYPFILVGLVHTVLAVLIIVFLAKSDGEQWFNRQRA
ncbi:hypothetical protein ACWDZ4_06675 [Streptomyces sp. NPDC003016]